MTHSNVLVKKPAIKAEYLPHRIVKEGKIWFQSTKQPNGTFYWKRLSSFEDLDEEGTLEIKSKYAETTMRLILDELRSNPNYKVTWLDRQTFYDNRVQYPALWNSFINITHSDANKDAKKR